MSNIAKTCPACENNILISEVVEHVLEVHGGAHGMTFTSDDGANQLSLIDKFTEIVAIPYVPRDTDYAEQTTEPARDPITASGFNINDVMNAADDNVGMSGSCNDTLWKSMTSELGTLIGDRVVLNTSHFLAQFMIRVIATDGNEGSEGQGSVTLRGTIDESLASASDTIMAPPSKVVPWTDVDQVMSAKADELNWDYKPRRIARWLGPMIWYTWTRGTLFNKTFKETGTSLSQRLNIPAEYCLATLSFFDAIVPPSRQTQQQRKYAKFAVENKTAQNNTIGLVSKNPRLVVDNTSESNVRTVNTGIGQAAEWTRVLDQQNASNNARYGVGADIYQRGGGMGPQGRQQ